MRLWRDLVTVLVRPYSALVIIRDRRTLREGLLALGLAFFLPTLVGELAASAPYRPLQEFPSPSAEYRDLVLLFNRWLYAERFILPAVQLVVSLGLWMTAVLLIHFLARRLGGEGALRGYLKIAGFVALVGLTVLPISLARAALTAAGRPEAVGGLGSASFGLSVALFLWQNFLLVAGAQVHYGLPAERAVTAVIGPVGCVFLLLVALLVASVLAVVAGSRLSG